METLVLNPCFKTKLSRIGQEQNQLLVIDDLFENPEVLVEYAANTSLTFGNVTGDYYPGVRKVLPPTYGVLLVDGLCDLIQKSFGCASSLGATAHFCALSLATQPGEKLLPIQRIPHFDTSNDHQFAVVVYLCDEAHGGTAFYRHRRTGFEAVTDERARRYQQVLENEAYAGNLPAPGYIRGDTSLFTQVARVSARFNRAVIYHSNLLHSGEISAEGGLSADPRKGRLTANAFISMAGPLARVP